jgi:D-amino-acid dehydrogenase
MEKTDIVVLGGGVIGLSVALRMLNSGREVVLIDPEKPGSGTSYGNAGTIAEYAVLPIGSPDVLKRLPSLLFNKNSPIAIKRSEFLSRSLANKILVSIDVKTGCKKCSIDC